MTSNLPFHYESKGRTAFHGALLALGIGMLALALVLTAPWFVILPLAAFAAMMAYLVLRNPRAGLAIDSGAIEFWHGRRHERIAVTEIAQVQIKRWSESVDVAIHRHDGAVIDLPDRCRPAAESLTPLLESAGITVTES